MNWGCGLADIFISSKKTDIEHVRLIAEALEAQGFSVWWDYDIEVGDHWLEAIVREIDRAKIILGVWTSNSVDERGLFTSKYVEVEHRRAPRRLFPIQLTPGAIAFEFSSVQALQVHTLRGEAFSASMQTLALQIREFMKSGERSAVTSAAEKQLEASRRRGSLALALTFFAVNCVLGFFFAPSANGNFFVLFVFIEYAAVALLFARIHSSNWLACVLAALASLWLFWTIFAYLFLAFAPIWMASGEANSGLNAALSLLALLLYPATVLVFKTFEELRKLLKGMLGLR